MHRHNRLALTLAAVATIVAIGGLGGAAQAKDAHAGDAHAVRKTCHQSQAAIADVPQQVSRAWDANDLTAFGAVFTRDASFIVPGQDTYLTSREEIVRYMAAIFEGPYRDVLPIAVVRNIKCVAPQVAVVVTQGGLLLPGETEVPLERIGRQTWVAVHVGQRWLVTAYQNSRITPG